MMPHDRHPKNEPGSKAPAKMSDRRMQKNRRKIRKKKSGRLKKMILTGYRIGCFFRGKREKSTDREVIVESPFC